MTTPARIALTGLQKTYQGRDQSVVAVRGCYPDLRARQLYRADRPVQLWLQYRAL